MMNRVGDWGIIIGLILWYVSILTLSWYVFIPTLLITLIAIPLIIGAIAKSAQIGLHSWLTQAMEGPTPVSALLHSATMVTAGVYLIMKLSVVLEWNSNLLIIVCWIGAISALSGALGGLFEYDIKKIIAYSTISQLGYMVLALGLSLYNLALWHVINHAFFKSLLFLTAGSLIHSVFDNQDIRKYGNLSLGGTRILLFIFFIANLSLMAFPFLTGFYSKDLILESAYNANTFFFILVYIAAFITTAYSMKILLYVFMTKPNVSYEVYGKISNKFSIAEKIPLLI